MKMVKAWAAVIFFGLLLAAAAVAGAVIYDEPNIHYDLQAWSRIVGQILMLPFGLIALFNMMRLWADPEMPPTRQRHLILTTVLAGLFTLGFYAASWGAAVGLGLFGAAWIWQTKSATRSTSNPEKESST